MPPHSTYAPPTSSDSASEKSNGVLLPAIRSARKNITAKGINCIDIDISVCKCTKSIKLVPPDISIIIVTSNMSSKCPPKFCIYALFPPIIPYREFEVVPINVSENAIRDWANIIKQKPFL